jgi:4'-phosphopantetheinyl transferase EntD
MPIREVRDASSGARRDSGSDTEVCRIFALQIKSLLPVAMAIEIERIDEARESMLHPTELAAITNAVLKRRNEFIAGRTSAKRALQRLGYSCRPIPVGSMREPIWPVGVIGSITHEGAYAISALARTRHISLLGIDLASRDALSGDLVPMICRDDEIEGIQRHERHFGGDDLFKLVFSIKESVYKCLFPVVRKLFDFSDVSVEFTYRKGRTEAEVVLRNPVMFSHVTSRLNVAYVYAADYVFTGVWSEATRVETWSNGRTGS